LLTKPISHLRALMVWTFVAVWLVVDYGSPPLPSQPLNIPGFYFQLSQDPSRAAVLEVPTRIDDLVALESYNYFQTVHNKPIAIGFLARQDEAFVRRTELLRRARQSDAALNALLDELGPAYVIVHKLALTVPEERAFATRLATALASSRIYEDDEIVAYGWKLPQDYHLPPRPGM
jgi:hypothetical protein